MNAARTLAALLVVLAAFGTAAHADDLRTVAESSDYRRTATSDEVEDLLRRLDAASPRTVLGSIGNSFTGRSIPLLVVADPPVASADAARESGRLVILLFGNIHAGEVCGKEALLRLARELSAGDPILEHAVVLIVPNYNPDGNDRFALDNRPGQVGPAEGMGVRPNAMGLDLNRDWIKLASPEARAMVALHTTWDPDLVVDTHTTNGSKHRYTLTYAAPNNPSGHAPSIAFVRDELLPAVTERLRADTGYDSFFYGNFDRAHTTWTTYSAQPRFGAPYRGLRGQMAILSEAYAYATYEDRVLATHAFVRAILDFAVEHRGTVRALHEMARVQTTNAGANPQPDDLVSIRHRVAAWPEPVTLKGYALAPDEEGVLRPTDEPADHVVVHRGRFEPTRSVRRPHAYLVPNELTSVLDNLRRHGVRIDTFEGTARVERATIDAIDRARRPFQGARLVTLETTTTVAHETYDEPVALVRLDQPLGTLVVHLLEAECDDGLAAWGFLDDRLEVGAAYPIVRVAAPGDLRE